MIRQPEPASGTLLPASRPEPVETPDRKTRKRQAKLRRDAARPPRSSERFKMLLDVIGEQRQVVNLEDHRARYAMVIAGLVNAGLYVVGTRATRSGWLPPAAAPWATGIGLAYAAVSTLFIFCVIDCLRPRTLDRKGLLHWEGALKYDLTRYEAAWRDVSMDQLNREAVQISHLLARMIDEKCRANRRLYRGLTALTLLGAVILTTLAAASR